MAEWRIYGPPGTGKTTYLAGNDQVQGQISKAVEARGPGSVLVTSFTRAAAQELISRIQDIDRDMVGTLHAVCYRALGSPTVAETKVDEFNAQAPAWAALGKQRKKSMDEPYSEEVPETPADDLFSAMQVLRSRMAPRAAWPETTRQFAEEWDRWKAESGYIDFTDMIEMALQDVDEAPGGPSVLMHDEAQDSTPLQWALLRKWAKHVDDFIAVGDPDQLLYSWLGATPESMFSPPIPDANKRVLRQSYRLPRAVHAKSQEWISQVAVRETRTCAPRDADGEVRASAAVWREPKTLLDELGRMLDGHHTAMVLASCGYMLSPLVSALRGEGMPYHNPYRRTRGDWNPLHPKTVDNLMSFLRPDAVAWGARAEMWSFADLRAWVPLIKSEGNLRRGAKRTLRGIGEGELDQRPTIMWMLENLFEERAFHSILDCDLDWFVANLLNAPARVMAYPVLVLKKHGASSLRERPRLIVGTCHSVKGGESDAVLLLPDLSPAGDRAWRGDHDGAAGREAHDSVVRTFYVGMTRARESLVLASASGSMTVW